ncbi:MAG: 23S rRNA (cytosine1962-C5)-methyltransferase [Bradymonadia bacterium]|jgi:23S rRNA (cytosine1962-C5)-methyltransferase
MNDPTAFANRLRKNHKHIAKWAKRHDVTCYRIYDRDMPEVPFAIDWYDGRVHVSEYQRRNAEERPDSWLGEHLVALSDALGVSDQELYFKQRDRQRGTTQYGRVSDDLETVVVEEAGQKFLVNLSDFVDTGLFLDHRPLRQHVRKMCAGKRVLNLFGYTGAFSVQAAAGGASETCTVDMSATYLAWAGKNMDMNGHVGPNHKLLQVDVLQWMTQDAPVRAYDIIVLDPPTFSNSKRMRESFEVQRDHIGLIRDAQRLLAPGGMIYFSSNKRGFKVDEGALPGSEFASLTRWSVPEDFKRSKPHQSWAITTSS